MDKKKIIILGSTGSIGTQALEVVSENPGLKVTGLAAAADYHSLIKQAKDFNVKNLAIVDENAGAKLFSDLPDSSVFTGPEGLNGLIRETECDLVLNSVVGAAGLEATMAALEKGVDLALANKESLVVGGDLVIDAARRNKARILPVDSEHSAIFQCLQGEKEKQAERIFLTASGGPFFGKSKNDLAGVTREDALKHPRWEMGSKITVDSATLMNKGLEIIEAHYLFNTGYEDIEVVVHPQSIVHSLVRFGDGSIIAQMGLPSMKLPISYALNYPERKPVAMDQLDLPAVGELTFFKPDMEVFPCLKLAMEAGESGGGAPVALNAANEIAVSAFLEGTIGFLEIAALVDRTLTGMEKDLPGSISDLQQVTEIDSAARRLAKTYLSR